MKTISATVVLFSAAGLATQAGAAAIPTVGVYDENVFATNTVDVSATPLTVGTFSTLIASAFSANQGGVWTLDSGPHTGNLTSFDLSYGVSQANVLKLTSTSGVGRALDDVNVETISGEAGGKYFMSFVSQNWTWTFDTGLSAFGLTVLSRDGNRNVTLSATLDDATVVPIVSNYTVLAGTAGQNDTFFGYQASVGRSIVSITNSGGSFLRLDDIGFVVVPEPTSLASLAVLALVAGRRRRVG